MDQKVTHFVAKEISDADADAKGINTWVEVVKVSGGSLVNNGEIVLKMNKSGVAVLLQSGHDKGTGVAGQASSD